MYVGWKEVQAFQGLDAKSIDREKRMEEGVRWFEEEVRIDLRCWLKKGREDFIKRGQIS